MYKLFQLVLSENRHDYESLLDLHLGIQCKHYVPIRIGFI